MVTECSGGGIMKHRANTRNIRMKTLKKTRQNQRYSDGDGECTGRTCGNDVARRGEAGDRGMVNNAWTDLDRRISREIDGGTRRTVGHGGEGQQVK